MAVSLNAQSISYLEDDTGINTRINIYKYQRPRPGAKLLKVPVSFITLPLPVQMPDDHYSMQIGAENLGEIGNLTGGQSGESLAQLRDTLKERLNVSGLGGDAAALGLAAIAASPAIADMAVGAGILGKSGKAVLGGLVSSPLAKVAAENAKANLGLARNPHTALLFNGVDLRQFTFTWRLSPRSQAQSQNLNKIINQIKRAMHPNLALGGFALDYPNLFTVEFNNDKEGIINLGYSFCQDFRINPTPSGHVYYKDGYPSIVEMSMTVKEFQIKTTEDFQDISSHASGSVLNSDAFVK
jgi:hypothetical protein